MKQNWNFLGGMGVQNKKPYVGGIWIGVCCPRGGGGVLRDIGW